MANKLPEPHSLDEEEIIAHAGQALKQIADMLEKHGLSPAQQPPDVINLLHAKPAFTKKVDKLLNEQDPTPSKPSTKERTPRRPKT